MNGRASTRLLLWLIAGFLVWASALVVMYSLQGLGCGLGWTPGAIRIVLGVALAAHLAVLAYIAYRAQAARSSVDGAGLSGGFWTVAVWSTYAAAAATLLGLLPPLFLTACAP